MSVNNPHVVIPCKGLDNLIICQKVDKDMCVWEESNNTRLVNVKYVNK